MLRPRAAEQEHARIFPESLAASAPDAGAGKLHLGRTGGDTYGRKRQRFAGRRGLDGARAAGGRAGPRAGKDQRRATQGWQQARATRERAPHLRRLAGRDNAGPEVGAPGQLHLPERHHRPALRRGPLAEGCGGRARPGAARLVRLHGRAAIVLGVAQRSGRGGPVGEPARPGRAARGDPTRPPQASGR